MVRILLRLGPLEGGPQGTAIDLLVPAPPKSNSKIGEFKLTEGPSQRSRPGRLRQAVCSRGSNISAAKSYQERRLPKPPYLGGVALADISTAPEATNAMMTIRSQMITNPSNFTRAARRLMPEEWRIRLKGRVAEG